ncbi:HPr kinase/phosphorylase [Spiribacter sp. 2438]|uniref:HPr kinase/phosphorylase n=1 Tax=Spiribacter sp. 2438 TaxID=2666185 RepID=UPI0018A202C6|nr:hypothetical protein [Spiribacter sp. 2438]
MIRITGTLVSIQGRGVLLRGAAGSGKSDTALQLIERGHPLVADDAVDLQRLDGRLTACAPVLGRGLLFIRGIGVVDVATRYGQTAVLASAPLDLLVDLERTRSPESLEGSWTQETLAGVSVPRLAICPGRPVASLIVLAARECHQPGAGGRAMATRLETALMNTPAEAPLCD